MGFAAMGMSAISNTSPGGQSRRRVLALLASMAVLAVACGTATSGVTTATGRSAAANRMSPSTPEAAMWPALDSMQQAWVPLTSAIASVQYVSVLMARDCMASQGLRAPDPPQELLKERPDMRTETEADGFALSGQEARESGYSSTPFFKQLFESGQVVTRNQEVMFDLMPDGEEAQLAWGKAYFGKRYGEDDMLGESETSASSGDLASASEGDEGCLSGAIKSLENRYGISVLKANDEFSKMTEVRNDVMEMVHASEEYSRSVAAWSQCFSDAGFGEYEDPMHAIGVAFESGLSDEEARLQALANADCQDESQIVVIGRNLWKNYERQLLSDSPQGREIVAFYYGDLPELERQVAEMLAANDL